MPKTMPLSEYRDKHVNAVRAKKKRNHPEHDIQATYFAIIDLEENRKNFPYLKFIFAVPNGANRSKAEAGKSKGEGQRPGCPDIVFPFVRRTSPGAFVEMKAPDGYMKPNQKEWRDFLVDQGYRHELFRSVDEILDFTEWYLDIKLVRGTRFK